MAFIFFAFLGMRFNRADETQTFPTFPKTFVHIGSTAVKRECDIRIDTNAEHAPGALCICLVFHFGTKVSFQVKLLLETNGAVSSKRIPVHLNEENTINYRKRH